MGTEPITAAELTRRACRACEGGVPPLSPDEVRGYLPAVPNWKTDAELKLISRSWIAKNFMAAIRFFDRVAEVAESEGHHPDLHLVGYRHVTIDLWTHAIGGLSENDFILAAKIDALPFETRA